MHVYMLHIYKRTYNVVGLLGISQPMADGLKLLVKEWIPRSQLLLSSMHKTLLG